MLSMDVGFYDDEANSPGELALFLSEHVVLIEPLFGENSPLEQMSR